MYFQLDKRSREKRDRLEHLPNVDNVLHLVLPEEPFHVQDKWLTIQDMHASVCMCWATEVSLRDDQTRGLVVAQWRWTPNIRFCCSIVTSRACDKGK